MGDSTATEDITKYAPQEHEVLLNRAERRGSFLIIPLSRSILSAAPYKDTTRPADALLLRQARIRGSHGERLYEFNCLIEREVTLEILNEHSFAMGYQPHEKALPEIRRILGKMFGNTFLDRTLTEKERMREAIDGLQRWLAPVRMSCVIRLGQPPINERLKHIARR